MQAADIQADPRDVITRRQRARLVRTRYPGAPTESEPGELLTMGDGGQWFHPYSGGAPVKITDANRAGLELSA